MLGAAERAYKSQCHFIQVVKINKGCAKKKKQKVKHTKPPARCFPNTWGLRHCQGAVALKLYNHCAVLYRLYPTSRCASWSAPRHQRGSVFPTEKGIGKKTNTLTSMMDGLLQYLNNQPMQLRIKSTNEEGYMQNKIDHPATNTRAHELIPPTIREAHHQQP